MSNNTSPNEEINKWIELKLFFDGRFTKPLQHPEYILYFILVIIGFGGLGVWSCFFSFTHENIISNLMSFAVAIIATGSIDLMFTTNEAIKYPLLFLAIIIIFASFGLYILSINVVYGAGYIIAIPITLFALYVWWIANSENANLTKNYFREQSTASMTLNQSLNDYDESR